MRILLKYQIAYPITAMFRCCGKLRTLMLIQLGDAHIPLSLTAPVLVGQHEMLRSLLASTVELLDQILDPESKDNPVPRIQTRWRVYTVFILMLHQGLRRGAVLLLPGDAIKSALDAKPECNRCRSNVRENTHFGQIPNLT